MNIKLHTYQLEFVFPFRIAHGIRTHTDALFVEMEHEGASSWGEATFPPYLKYTRDRAVSSFSAINPDVLVSQSGQIIDPAILHHIFPGLDPPALAGLDMALWTLRAYTDKSTIGQMLGITETYDPPRSYTISVCDKNEMSQRLDHGRSKGFSFFKLKLNGADDQRMLNDFRSLSDTPFAVDANQSWDDIRYALEFSKELQQQGCVLIEQPFHKDDLVNTRKLGAELSIPIIADEACQAIDDIDKVKGAFSGINVKLQKCGGITPAFEMIKYARSIGLKVLIGCMSESAIGCAAGEVLSPLCDWNDLDGKYLVKDISL